MLASVARLHEVIGGGKVGTISGLAETPAEVAALGIENVDLSSVMEGEWARLFVFCNLCDAHRWAYRFSSGHFDIAGKMPEILRLIDLRK